MKINCPQCGATLKVVVYSADDVHTCPKCSAQFRTGGTLGANAPAKSPPPDDDWLNEVGASSPPTSAAPAKPPAKPPATPAPTAKPPAKTSATPAPPTKPQAKTKVPASPTPRPASPSDDRRTELPPLRIDLEDDSAAPASRSTPAPTSAGSLDFDSLGPLDLAALDAAALEMPPVNSQPQGMPSPGAATASDPDPLSPLDSDPLAPLDAPPPLALDAGRYAFSVDCRICGTRMDFVSEQIGSEAKCPDCETTVVLTEPLSSRRRPLHQVDETDFSRLRGEECAPAAVQLESPEVQKQRADDLLKRAEKEIEDEIANQPDEFDDKSTKALFQFLFESPTLVRIGGVAATGCVAFALLSAVYAARGPATMSDLVNVFLYALIGPVLVGWLLVLGAHVVAVFRDTANGSASVHSWPDFMGGSLLYDGLFPCVAVFLSMIPSMALSMLAGAFGTTLGTLVGILTFVPSVLFLTPLIFLSMTSDNSLMTPFRPRVWKAMMAAGQSTVTFYIASFVLVVLLHAGMHMVLIGNLFMRCVVSFVMVVDAFVYFRLLGWLARKCREAFEDEEEVEESS